VGRQRFAELVEDLRRLDPGKIRLAVHLALPKVAERDRFDGETATAAHAVLVDAAARLLVRAEILASYRDRVSGVHPVAVARVQLVRRTG